MFFSTADFISRYYNAPIALLNGLFGIILHYYDDGDIDIMVPGQDAIYTIPKVFIVEENGVFIENEIHARFKLNSFKSVETQLILEGKKFEVTQNNVTARFLGKRLEPIEKTITTSSGIREKNETPFTNPEIIEDLVKAYEDLKEIKILGSTQTPFGWENLILILTVNNVTMTRNYFETSAKFEFNIYCPPQLK
jgi:hypothetical protein